MGEHDQQPTGEQDPQEQASHSDAAEAETDHAGRDEGAGEPDAPSEAPEDFVDDLAAEDEWEVLNTQKDVALHLHSQTTRFLQLLFTLVGLVLTGLAVLGPSTIAMNLSLKMIPEIVSTTGWLDAFLVGVIIARHLLESVLDAVMLLSLVGFRLVLGLTIYPAVGDDKTNPTDRAEWIQTNRDQLDDLNERLSDGYSYLFWLSIHAVMAVTLYYGLLYPGLFPLYGLAISFGVMMWVAIMRSLPEAPDEREEYMDALQEKPVRVLWALLDEEYRRAVNETDSRIGAGRRFLRHGSHFVWLFVHALFLLLIIL